MKPLFFQGLILLKISARWTIIDDKIRFTIDSSEYYMYNPLNSGLSTLEANDSSYKIETPKEEITMHLTNAVSFEEYEKATKIYGESFAYYISLDTLKLIAPNVKIRAIRYRTIEDLLKNIKP